jgi:hypothetical protein
LIEDFLVKYHQNLEPESFDQKSNRAFLKDEEKLKLILEKNFTGTDFLISNEFIILGSNEQYLTEHKIIISEYEQEIVRRGQIITRKIAEQTFSISNYRQRLHNHLEFSFTQNNIGNYSVTARLLDNSDVSQIIDQSDLLLINASRLCERKYVV